MQYHKPWGMGTVDLWALTGNKADESLVSLFLRVEVRRPKTNKKQVGNYSRLCSRLRIKMRQVCPHLTVSGSKLIWFQDRLLLREASKSAASLLRVSTKSGEMSQQLVLYVFEKTIIPTLLALLLVSVRAV